MDKKPTKMQQTVIDYIKNNLKIETNMYRDVYTEGIFAVAETTLILGDEIISSTKSSIELKERR